MNEATGMSGAPSGPIQFYGSYGACRRCAILVLHTKGRVLFSLTKSKSHGQESKLYAIPLLHIYGESIADMMDLCKMARSPLRKFSTKFLQ